MNNFADIIEELGEEFDEPMNADLNQSCTLMVNESIEVHLEIDIAGEFVLVAAIIAELPPGRFRENILKDALKSNFLYDMQRSSIAYLAAENQLIVFANVHMHALSGKELYNEIALVADRAEKWKNAIEGGRTSPDDESEIPKGSTSERPPLFGFK